MKEKKCVWVCKDIKIKTFEYIFHKLNKRNNEKLKQTIAWQHIVQSKLLNYKNLMTLIATGNFYSYTLLIDLMKIISFVCLK